MMETVTTLRHGKVAIYGLLSRRLPLLQILKSVKTVEIVFKKSSEELHNDKAKRINSKVSDQNATNELGDKNELKNQNKEKLKNFDDKLGWFVDKETKKVVYFDTFTKEDIWRIRGLEEKHKKKHELMLCREYKTKSFSIKVPRLEFYKCKFCDLTYKSIVSRRLHERTHSTKDLWECGKCGKTFPLKVYLDQHENKHIELKRFRCTICGKRFSYGSGLAKHKKKSHSELPNRFLRLKLEKYRKHLPLETPLNASVPYGCDVCGRTFSRGIAFANHKRGHNPNKKFKCSYCAQEFKLEYNFQEHIKKFHQESTDDEDGTIQA